MKPLKCSPALLHLLRAMLPSPVSLGGGLFFAPVVCCGFLQTGGGEGSSSSDVESGGLRSHGGGSVSRGGGLRQRGGGSSNGIARLPPFAKHQRVAQVADAVDRW